LKIKWFVSAFMLFLAVSLGSSSCATAPLPEGEVAYRIAVVVSPAGIEEEVTKRAFMGITRLAEEYNGYIRGEKANSVFGSAIEFRRVETGSEADIIYEDLASLAEEGYELILGIGFRFRRAIQDVAAAYPQSHFVAIEAFDIEQRELDNFTHIYFRVDEATFLAGAVAGMMHGDGKVGAVGGMDVAGIRVFTDGFFAGASYTSPALSDESMRMENFIGSFSDTELAYNAAKEMYDSGAQIVFQAAGIAGRGVLRAASDAGKWAIGVDVDQGLLYALSADPRERQISRHILTSSLNLFDRAIYLVCREFITKGSLPPGHQSVGLREGCVDIAINPYNSLVLSPIRDSLDRIRGDIIAGRLEIGEADENLWAGSAVEPKAAVDQSVVSVIDPVPSGGVSEQEATLIANALSSSLFKTGRFRVIDRGQRENLLSEIQFSFSDMADRSEQLEVGRLLAADAVVVGTVGVVGERYVLDFKQIEVETGLTLSIATIYAEKKEDMLDRIEEVANELAR
jgi:basic membrane protein A